MGVELNRQFICKLKILGKLTSGFLFNYVIVNKFMFFVSL